ncbi:acyclic terpene utilization AtuA family protein [Cupriavidus basilensis]
MRHGDIDYLVFDYLAELTMSILAAARLRKPELGYATDFVTVTNEGPDRRDRRTRDPRGQQRRWHEPARVCAGHCRLAAEQGPTLRIAVVEGDDVMPLLPQLREAGVQDMQQGRPLPEHVVSANAYLGALADPAGAGPGGPDRHHRTLRGQCRDTRRADARVRLACGRL